MLPEVVFDRLHERVDMLSAVGAEEGHEQVRVVER